MDRMASVRRSRPVGFILGVDEMKVLPFARQQRAARARRQIAEMNAAQVAQQSQKRGWMCLTDYHHELGEAAGGVTIYPDLDDLKANRPCWDQCGVVEVGIVIEKVQERQE